jgi:branched-chain amino acid transport system substrate-binding protein
MKKTVSLVLSAVAAASLALPGLAAAAPIKIGFINSITGPNAPIGENLTNGMELAVEDLKKKGLDLQVIKQDDTGKPDKAISAIEQLATGDEVSIVVGAYSSACSAAVAKQSEVYQVPQIIPASSKEEITRQGYKWVFRLNAPGGVYAKSLIDAALSFGKPKTIAFIYESTDFGSSLSKVGKEYATQKGLKVVADEGYQAGSPDYRSTLAKVKGQNPDLVFMISYVADAILLMRQSRELGLKPQAFLGGGAGFDTENFEKEAQISTNVFSVTQWTPDSSKASEGFSARYQQKYGKRPSYHAACTYASMMVAGDVAAKAGGDRVKIQKALLDGTWNGIMGQVKFKAYDGMTNQNEVLMPVTQYLGGKSVTVFPPSLAKAKAVYPFPGWK